MPQQAGAHPSRPLLRLPIAERRSRSPDAAADRRSSRPLAFAPARRREAQPVGRRHGRPLLPLTVAGRRSASPDGAAGRSTPRPVAFSPARRRTAQLGGRRHGVPIPRAPARFAAFVARLTRKKKSRNGRCPRSCYFAADFFVVCQLPSSYVWFACSVFRCAPTVRLLCPA